MIVNNIFKSSLLFTLLFIGLTILINPFQLIGLTDIGFFITALYNIKELGLYETSLLDRSSYITNLLLLSFYPLSYIKDPIFFTYVMYYITYMLWFMVSYYLLFKTFNIKNLLLYFLMFFSSITILIHYSLNHNGWHSIYISIPFLLLSYYQIYIKKNYFLGIIIYVPLFFLQVSFILMFTFLILTFYFIEKEKKYLIYFITSLIFLIAYLKFLPLIIDNQSSSTIMNERYGYLFNFTSFEELFRIIINKAHIKIAMMSFFFIPFLFLIKIRSIKKIDLLIYATLITPIFGYSFFSLQIPTSYWVHEHYGLPLLALVFIIIFKYGSFTKIRIAGYITSNILLFVMILSLKQPWQYKYYLDEKQLIHNIIPNMALKPETDILSEEKTGIYFTNSQVNYIKEVYFNNKKRVPKYVVFNLRYSYFEENFKRDKPKNPISSFKYIKNFEPYLKNYGIIYLNYPFIVFEINKENSNNYTEDLLNEWDKKTIPLNSWLED